MLNNKFISMKKFKFNITNVWSCLLFWWLNDGKEFDYFSFRIKKIQQKKNLLLNLVFAILIIKKVIL